MKDLDRVTDYCNLYVNPTLLDGLAELVRVKPIEPILYLAGWLLSHDPFQPHFTQNADSIKREK